MAEKIVIYTSITGGYDSLKQPAVVADGFEFICFVSKGMKHAEYDGVWRIEEIPYPWDDMTLLSRSQKMNPQAVLPEDCNWSLWIDGNIRITDSSIYDLCRQLQEQDVKYAGIKHPFRDCVYQEMCAVLKDRRIGLGELLRLTTFLRKKRFPEHAGLMENNLIFRKHNDETVVEFDRWWWECFLKFPPRDQLTHSFALYDTPALKADYLFEDGVSVRNYPGLEYVKHPGAELSWWERKRKYWMNKPQLCVLRCWQALSKLIWR